MSVSLRRARSRTHRRLGGGFSVSRLLRLGFPGLRSLTPAASEQQRQGNQLSVINPALKGRALWRTTWNTKLHHFPASTGALGRRSLHRQSRAIRTAFQNFCSVEVSVIEVTAAGTAKALTVARLRIDRATSGAGLGTVRRCYFDQLTAAPGELVTQELDQAGPPGVGDSARERTISDHVCGLQTLNDNCAVALGVGGGERVKQVVALAANFAVQPLHAKDGFLSIGGAFLSPRDDALSFGEPLQSSIQGLSVCNQLAIRVSDKIGDAAVQCDTGLCPRLRIWPLDLTDDRYEPLIAVAAKCATLGISLERPMHDGTQVAELRETQHADSRSARPWDAAR